MKLRTILFGYMFNGNGYILEPSESETVNLIFTEYIGGKTIIEIADKLTKANVRYSENKETWDKNMVYRILTDNRFAGNSVYPQIIPEETFAAANIKITRKTDEVLPDEIQWLKLNIVCHCCGKLLSRRKMRDGSYRWICPYGCINGKIIRDNDLSSDVIERLAEIKNNPDAIKNVIARAENIKSPEVMKHENEIERLISNPDSSYNFIKSVVVECVSSRYECCQYTGENEISDIIADTLQTLSPGFDLLKRICKKVTIDEKGAIHLFLKNGKDYGGES